MIAISLVSGQIGVLARERANRKRDWMKMKSMWSDVAARRFLDAADELEREDAAYGRALGELDATFDQANKLLGSI